MPGLWPPCTPMTPPALWAPPPAHIISLHPFYLLLTPSIPHPPFLEDLTTANTLQGQELLDLCKGSCYNGDIPAINDP